MLNNHKPNDQVLYIHNVSTTMQLWFYIAISKTVFFHSTVNNKLLWQIEIQSKN